LNTPEVEEHLKNNMQISYLIIQQMFVTNKQKKLKTPTNLPTAGRLSLMRA
jgi:hypothetical protein